MYAGALKPVAQLATDNTVVATFVYATRPHVPDYMRKGGEIYRFLVDHLGSVRMVVNVADGSIAQRIDYDEFGNVLTDTAPGFQPFGFAGGLYDPDTGLTRFGARDYDPVAGRWTAKDSVLFAGGDANLYAYVHSDPVNWIDPNGTTAWAAAAVGAEIGTVIAPGLGTAIGAVAGRRVGGLGRRANRTLARRRNRDRRLEAAICRRPGQHGARQEAEPDLRTRWLSEDGR